MIMTAIRLKFRVILLPVRSQKIVFFHTLRQSTLWLSMTHIPMLLSFYKGDSRFAPPQTIITEFPGGLGRPLVVALDIKGIHLIWDSFVTLYNKDIYICL